MMTRKITVVIITNPHGNIVASALDGGGVDAAGFSQEAEQKRRAKQRALISFAKTHLNDWMAAKVKYEDALNLWDLAQESGYKMSIQQIEGKIEND